MALLCLIDYVAKSYHVDYQCKCADDGHSCRVGIGASAFHYSVEGAVSVQSRKGCPLGCCGAVREGALEERENLSEHTPDCKGVGAVLNPSSSVPEYGGDGRSEKQRDTAVPGETYKDALDRVTEIAQQHMMEVTERYR